MLTLEEVKLYLRVDGDDEDILITSLIDTAQKMVEDILRKELKDFEEIPPVINQAMLLIVATLFESRQIGGNTSIKMDDLLNTIKLILEPYREKVW